MHEKWVKKIFVLNDIFEGGTPQFRSKMAVRMQADNY